MPGILHAALLALLIQAVEPLLVLEPRNASSLRGSSAHFSCSTSERWVVMVWQLNGRALLSISVEHGPLGCSDDVCAVNRSTQAASTWEIVLNNIRFIPAAQEVACELLPFKDQRQTAYLFVQEKGTVTILGGNVSVQQGALLTLQCQAEGWYPIPTVSWTVDDDDVNSRTFNTSSVQDTTGLFNLTSVLRVRVERCSWVECVMRVPALYTAQRSAVSVSVESPEHDRAVVIGVFTAACTIALFALLALLLYCTHSHVESKPCDDGISGKNLGREAADGNFNLGYNQETTEGNFNLGYNQETTDGNFNLGYQQEAHSESRQDSHVVAGSTLKVPGISYIKAGVPGADSGREYFSVQRSGVPNNARLTTTV